MEEQRQQEGATLRQVILRWLDRHILCKKDEDRTGLENFIVDSARALADALYRYEKSNPAAAEHFEQRRESTAVAAILRGYNRINAEEAKRNLDAEALAIFRDPNE